MRSTHTTRSGETRRYVSVLLRRSVRDGGKVRKQTLANLSMLPGTAVDAVEAVLKGKTLVDADGLLEITRSLGHGHVAAVHAMAGKLGLPQLLGPACRQRDLAHALVVSRVARPASKRATLAWWDDVTLGPDLGVAGAARDEVYDAVDWLLARQDAIEARLAARHLREGGIAMFDLSSSWVEGTHCELAAFGYSRDGKRGKPQIEYGLLTDEEGRPVAVRVFAGNVADPTAFTEITADLRTGFSVNDLILVGDRGMITSARIRDLAAVAGMAWVTCLRAPAIKKLATDGGPLQMSLFDEHNLAEIRSPDYPGERLIACRNPVLAEDRARTRDELLADTEAALARIESMVAAGRLTDPDKIGLRVGKVINKRKVGKHFIIEIGPGRLAWRRNQASIATEAAIDGIYVIRTPVPADVLDAAAAVAAYKNLSEVEQDFRISKDDLDLRPIYHRLADRVRGHVLICMLACYLAWHLRTAWAPLTYADEHRPQRNDPVTPARRSHHGDTKATRHTDDDGRPLHDFRGLLDHLATLTRNTVTIAGQTFDKITNPTPVQRRAFQLIDAPVPLAITTR